MTADIKTKWYLVVQLGRQFTHYGSTAMPIKILTHTSTPTSDLIFLLTKITSGVTSSRNTLNPDIAYTVVKQERVYNSFHFIEIKHDAGMIGYIKNKK